MLILCEFEQTHTPVNPHQFQHEIESSRPMAQLMGLTMCWTLNTTARFALQVPWQQGGFRSEPHHYYPSAVYLLLLERQRCLGRYPNSSV